MAGTHRAIRKTKSLSKTTSQLNEEGTGGRAAAGKQSNIGGKENGGGRRLVGKQERGRLQALDRRAGAMDLAVGKERDRTLVGGVGSIAMHPLVQGRNRRHTVQGKKEAKAKRRQPRAGFLQNAW